MTDVQKTIAQGAQYLLKAVNTPNSETNLVFEAFCEGASMALGIPMFEVMRREAERMMLDDVAGGDSRARTRWDNYWN